MKIKNLAYATFVAAAAVAIVIGSAVPSEAAKKKKAAAAPPAPQPDYGLVRRRSATRSSSADACS
ncbi:MAG: hypothetical protein WCC50_13690, partial [Pseudolabrys sp.]